MLETAAVAANGRDGRGGATADDEEAGAEADASGVVIVSKGSSGWVMVEEDDNGRLCSSGGFLAITGGTVSAEATTACTVSSRSVTEGEGGEQRTRRRLFPGLSGRRHDSVCVCVSLSWGMSTEIVFCMYVGAGRPIVLG
jgi:hypothetical protein